jgi:hypothetical protein
MKTATVRQARRLRDGRELVEVSCPHCCESHWLLTTAGSTVARCVAEPSRAFFIDVGSPVR